MDVLNKNLYLGTKQFALQIIKLQPEGKKIMSAKDFINGFMKK
jgi:methionyl-tRNA formyltransferase